MIFVDPDFVSKMDELADPAKAAVHTRDPVFMKNLQKMVKGGAISGPGLVIASSMLSYHRCHARSQLASGPEGCVNDEKVQGTARLAESRINNTTLKSSPACPASG